MVPRLAWFLGLLLCGAPACSGHDIRLGAARELPDAGASEPFDSFAEPVPLTYLSEGDAADDDPSLTSDLSLLYFNSEREEGAGKEDIWSAQRSGPDAAFDAPVNVGSLNSDARETGIALSADGLSIWFSSDREGGVGGLDVYTATRASRDADWSVPAHVPELSSPGDDLVSSVTAAGAALYLARRAQEEADYDLFRAERRGSGWDAPVALATLNGEDGDSDAFESAAGELLVFTRDEELVLAQRASPADAFSGVTPLDSLNSAEDDRDAWLSEDAHYVMFSSNRSGSYRLYEARR